MNRRYKPNPSEVNKIVEDTLKSVNSKDKNLIPFEKSSKDDKDMEKLSKKSFVSLKRSKFRKKFEIKGGVMVLKL
jgi:hypothetical protein